MGVSWCSEQNGDIGGTNLPDMCWCRLVASQNRNEDQEESSLLSLYLGNVSCTMEEVTSLRIQVRGVAWLPPGQVVGGLGVVASREVARQEEDLWPVDEGLVVEVARGAEVRVSLVESLTDKQLAEVNNSVSKAYRSPGGSGHAGLANERWNDPTPNTCSVGPLQGGPHLSLP